MALLNISKFKKDTGSEKVPDELPSLPDGSKPVEGATSANAGPATPAADAPAAPATDAPAAPATAAPATAAPATAAPATDAPAAPTTAAPAAPTTAAPAADGVGNAKAQDTLKNLKQSSADYNQAINKLNNGLAPDELPPLGEAPVPAVPLAAPPAVPPAAPPVAPPAAPPAVLPAAPPAALSAAASVASAPIQQTSAEVQAAKISDKNLFFSNLMSKFTGSQDKQSVEEQILSSATGEVISVLNKQWDEEKYDDVLTGLDNKIIEGLKPLENLEREWRSLKTEVSEKTKALHKKEKEIKETTTKLKEMLQQKKKAREESTCKHKKS